LWLIITPVITGLKPDEVTGVIAHFFAQKFDEISAGRPPRTYVY
jgi:hypothetical protein